MSINNFVSGGKIWDPIEKKERDLKAIKHFKRGSIAVLIVGLFLIVSSIVCATIFKGDSAFAIKYTDNSLFFDGQVRYFIFYLLGAFGPVLFIMGWVMLVIEKFSDEAEWVFAKKKRILLSLLAIIVLWIAMLNVVIGIGKEINNYNKTDDKQIETIQNWVKDKTGSTITENRAKVLLTPSIDDTKVTSDNTDFIFHTERKGDLSILITVVKETIKN